MKKIGFLIILIAIIIVGFLIWRTETQNGSETELDLTLEEKQELVRTYLQENISNLSPEKEVLGGTFYITEFEFMDSETCLINYEDGHIALRAKVNFNVSAQGDVEIVSFDLVSLEEETSVNFSKEGNILEVDQGWELIYEEPGAPALRVRLVFDDNSICTKEGEEDQACFPVYWQNGDRVTIKGMKTGEMVRVGEFKLITSSAEIDLESDLESENPETEICVDMCGDGVCQEMVCLGSGCPCAETAATCPQDCS